MQKYSLVIEQDPATKGPEDGSSPNCLERTFAQKTSLSYEEKN